MVKATYSNGETPRICIVGAGFSGLCAAIQLKKQLGLTSFTIFESNSDVGGTWLANTYPGCACDVMSHLYSYSFELNPDWSYNYSSQPEIWAYLKNVAKKYDLYTQIRFETQVQRLTWDENQRKWIVSLMVKNYKIEEEVFDVIINGPGVLRLPHIPPEFNSFKGPIIHSADWNPNVSLEGKIVGIVGSGASAVQIIPTIAPRVQELHTYQRKPAWVVPRPQFKFPELIKSTFSYIPLFMWLYRTLIFLLNELIFFAFKANSFFNNFGKKTTQRHLKKQIPGNQFLQNALTPNYSFGCKRITPSSDYYPALALPHVRLHRQKIIKVESDALCTEDGRQNIDILILATGFCVHDYFAPMEVIGRNSENVLSTWKKEGPRSYLGIIGSSTPNHFALLGPNTGIGHNTAVFMIECQVNFVVKVIREMMKRNARCVTPKLSSENEFMKGVKEKLKTTVWGSEDCGSWYANSAGIITVLWPQNCISYWWRTRQVDFSKFEFTP